MSSLLAVMWLAARCKLQAALLPLQHAQRRAALAVEKWVHLSLEGSAERRVQLDGDADVAVRSAGFGRNQAMVAARTDNRQASGLANQQRLNLSDAGTH